ncbi:hypothetical protein HKX48_002736 [Thoreauomyces humboldtii]|nr:hypothetical protein HKX48_002736 [Thoreauomyces humboldtii]
MGNKISKTLKKAKSKKNLKAGNAPAADVPDAQSTAAPATGGEASGVGASVVSPVAPVLPPITHETGADGMTSAVTQPLGDVTPAAPVASDAVATSAAETSNVNAEQLVPGGSAVPVATPAEASTHSIPQTLGGGDENEGRPSVVPTPAVAEVEPSQTVHQEAVQGQAPAAVSTESVRAAALPQEASAADIHHEAAIVPAPTSSTHELPVASAPGSTPELAVPSGIPTEATEAARDSSSLAPPTTINNTDDGVTASTASLIANVTTANEDEPTRTAARDAPAQVSEPPAETVSAVLVTAEIATRRAPRIAVVIHSTYGHVHTLAKSVVKGLQEAGADATLYKVQETLSAEVLEKMYANPGTSELPVVTNDDLLAADGFLFGLPTRYGCAPAQIKHFWDGTGGLWQSGALTGKHGGIFFSTASQHGGQETTALTFLSHYTHHGVIFVPLGYPKQLGDNSEPIGGGPFGSGTIAGGDGSRVPSAVELEVGEHQGREFAKIVARAV